MYTCDKHTLVDTKYDSEIPMQRISANEQCKQKRLTFNNYNDKNGKKQSKYIGIPWSDRKRGVGVLNWSAGELWWVNWWWVCPYCMVPWKLHGEFPR